MKLYKHSNGKTSIFPEHIPRGWEVLIRSDTFETVWRRIGSRR